MNGHDHTADDPDCHDTSCRRTAPSHQIHPDPAVRQLVAREVAAERERIAAAIEGEREKWEAKIPVPEGWDYDYILRRAGTEAGLGRAARIVRGPEVDIPSLVVCSAQYGSNPDLCYQPASHDGPHSNRYGCTWAADR